MPNANSLPRFSTPDHQREEDTTAEFDTGQDWTSEEAEEEEGVPPYRNDDERRHDDGEAHRKLYRAGKIDAYLSYLKMRPAVRESEPVTLRRSIQASERPPRRPFYDEAERETRLYGYQQRSIRRSS